MQPSDTSVSSITQAIGLLQDAVKKAAFDPAAVKADVTKAVNLLHGLLGIKAVGPDNTGGTN